MPATHTSDLDWLYERLQHLAKNKRGARYRIPALWNCWGYMHASKTGRGELAVAPYDFLIECLERVILPARAQRNIARRSLSQINGVRRNTANNVLDNGSRRRGGDWIKEAALYSLMIRISSAWDHNGDGQLTARNATETGTFLKTILLLPLLARLGVDVLYMLPISRCSKMFRKGDLGCPYSAINFFELEPDLHDKLLGPDDGEVDKEFAVFVEAAHAMNIRVMVDLAPRTASRDSDLILEHPEWFYWIDRRQLREYAAPHVENFKDNIPKPSELGGILRQDSVRHHIEQFRHAPNIAKPEQWRRFVGRCRTHPPRNLYRAIEKEFGLITPPAFSDCINDPQPPWSDVTFLRLFLDHPTASVKYLDGPKTLAPYVFTDSIKSSKFPGRRPNRELWKTLANILPFYQGFGVDGARVDMGHALPPALQDMIVQTPRKKDPDFAFLAEQFDSTAAATAKRDGYNSIIGMCWSDEARIKGGELHKLVHDVLPTTKLPSLATSEIADGPRAAVREGERAYAKLTAVLNQFLPNSIPLINSGFELLERQPMNLGLDPTPPGRFALPRKDPYYGKLAFFDRTVIHWTNTGARAMIALVGKANAIRRLYLPDLIDQKNLFFPKVAPDSKSIIVVGWRVDRGRSRLLIVANFDFNRAKNIIVSGASGEQNNYRLLLGTHADKGTAKLVHGKLRLRLEPGEARVLLA